MSSALTVRPQEQTWKEVKGGCGETLCIRWGSGRSFFTDYEFRPLQTPPSTIHIPSSQHPSNIRYANHTVPKNSLLLSRCSVERHTALRHIGGIDDKSAFRSIRFRDEVRDRNYPYAGWTMVCQLGETTDPFLHATFYAHENETLVTSVAVKAVMVPYGEKE